ncbi:nitrite/sulfite reductase [Thioalkalicoccus limnaeus]|uniref:Nitrite/sulfite reductase n=1 Tax=Thioalkalicoccus limnaeus TaxID=120681 RepID=A0ABV4BBZ6_9GAMM
MERYTPDEQQRIDARLTGFLDQLAQYQAGTLSEDAFRPLRLRNGLYFMREAPMLRVAIPYGRLASRQLRRLARIARQYDRGYAHLTTRQNVQLHWVTLADLPAILTELAEVGLYSIQTSGPTIRNITTDALAGAAADERADPRPWCEILRRWSLMHPAFDNLPGKFKIAVTGSPLDRALIRVHDLGFELHHDADGALGFRVVIGGGLGRNPALAEEIEDFLPWPHLRSYAEAVLRVYDRLGRRGIPYKTRLKTLVQTVGRDQIQHLVRQEWAGLADGRLTLSEAELSQVEALFAPPAYRPDPRDDIRYHRHLAANPAFAAWVQRNTQAHRETGFALVTLSTKGPATAPGDLTTEQMEQVARWAEAYSFGEVRVTREQNLVLAHVAQRDLFALWEQALRAGLAEPHRGLATDITACPGGRYCDLAKAETASLARAIQHRLADPALIQDIGELTLNVSGCVNGCAHHGVAQIGLRGVEKGGQDGFQIALGGETGQVTHLAEILGPALAAAEIPGAVARLIETYQQLRHPREPFIDTLRRVGLPRFREAVYAPLTPHLPGRHRLAPAGQSFQPTHEIGAARCMRIGHGN